MSTCFLFGHANTPRSAYPALVEAIENEISKGTKSSMLAITGTLTAWQ